LIKNKNKFIWITCKKTWYYSYYITTEFSNISLAVIWFQLDFTTADYVQRGTLIFVAYTYIAGFNPAFEALFQCMHDLFIISYHFEIFSIGLLIHDIASYNQVFWFIYYFLSFYPFEILTFFIAYTYIAVAITCDINDKFEKNSTIAISFLIIISSYG
jgi:hypothetical protein